MRSEAEKRHHDAEVDDRFGKEQELFSNAVDPIFLLKSQNSDSTPILF
ncbi:hypothetical protein ACFSQT_37630 [Mesorhizobium calcicola]|uniref:Uncharacterized protein n=1 Tax=Mesorhizobium calcicola TaxID=1300310 RepID=A0ABW4WR79_9HYPH